jgi:hypothetical protein
LCDCHCATLPSASDCPAPGGQDAVVQLVHFRLALGRVSYPLDVPAGP